MPGRYTRRTALSSDAGSLPQRREKYLELVAVIVLSATTILTAWTVFQATMWNGVQGQALNEAGVYRLESAKESALANNRTAIDVSTFIAWADAYAAERSDLADFLYARFRDEFRVAVDAWLATSPLENPDAPATPFDMVEYVVAAAVEGTRLVEMAEQRTADARIASERSDTYVAMTILFAAVLFFMGISTKFEAFRAKAVLTAMGSAGLIAGVLLLATFPIEL